MIIFGILCVYFFIGFLLSHLMIPSFWRRADSSVYPMKNYQTATEKERKTFCRLASRNNVHSHMIVTFLFWPIAAPLEILSTSVIKHDPFNAAREIEEYEKTVKDYRYRINLLESANDMELTQW